MWHLYPYQKPCRGSTKNATDWLAQPGAQVQFNHKIQYTTLPPNNNRFFLHLFATSEIPSHGRNMLHLPDLRIAAWTIWSLKFNDWELVRVLAYISSRSGPASKTSKTLLKREHRRKPERCRPNWIWFLCQYNRFVFACQRQTSKGQTKKPSGTRNTRRYSNKPKSNKQTIDKLKNTLLVQPDLKSKPSENSKLKSWAPRFPSKHSNGLIKETTLELVLYPATS